MDDIDPAGSGGSDYPVNRTPAPEPPIRPSTGAAPSAPYAGYQPSPYIPAPSARRRPRWGRFIFIGIAAIIGISRLASGGGSTASHPVGVGSCVTTTGSSSSTATTSTTMTPVACDAAGAKHVIAMGSMAGIDSNNTTAIQNAVSAAVPNATTGDVIWDTSNWYLLSN